MVFSEPENGKSSGGNLEEDTVFHQTAKSHEMNQVTTETVSSFMEATTVCCPVSGHFSLKLQ